MNILNQNKRNQNKTQESEIFGYMKRTSTGILLLPNRGEQEEKHFLLVSIGMMSDLWDYT
jgi:hypothetical protein